MSSAIQRQVLNQISRELEVVGVGSAVGRRLCRLIWALHGKEADLRGCEQISDKAIHLTSQGEVVQNGRVLADRWGVHRGL